MNCPKCKSELQPGAEKCEQCGAPVKKTKIVILRVVGILVFIALFVTAVVIYITHNKTLNPTPPSSGSTSDEQSVSDQVIYDKNGIKITYLYFENVGITPRFVFRIENSSILNIYANVSDVSVNDNMISTSLFTKVNAGKRATDYLYANLDDLVENGIYTVSKLEFELRISNADDEFGDPLDSTSVVIKF